MLEYGQTAGEPHDAGFADKGSPKPYSANLSAVISLVARNMAVIIALAVIGGLVGVGLTKVLTPRYVSTAQIYIDPRGLPGVDKDGAPLGQDSNGFINYVESLSLIIKSRTVLERVVAAEKLDHDDEFIGRGSLIPTILSGAPSAGAPTDENKEAAIRALDASISVRRPERTFVIDLSVRSRDPEKAARLANATARAFIEVASAMQSDSAHQATLSLASRLEILRTRVMAAEKRVEDFKAQNGLVSAQGRLVGDQQLAEMNQQLTAARARVDEARARSDQIQAARRRGGDVGAIAVELNLGTLATLRTQQADARQKLADLSAELGPKHPDVRDAEARVNEADRLVDAELARVAEASRNDYARAKETEAALSRQLDALKTQALADGQTSIGLRDLEREAEAARNVYELFVTRSRQTGDIQQVDADAPSMKIISMASTPNERSFPPRASLMGSVGILFGLAAALALAALRDREFLFRGMAPPERLVETPVMADGAPQPLVSPSAPPPPRRADIDQSPAKPTWKPPYVVISGRSRLESRRSEQSLADVDLAGLGFPALQAKSDGAEFRSVLDILKLREGPRSSDGAARSVAIFGDNESGWRSALAINLALAAAGDGLRVALIDAAAWNAKITRAVREATHLPMLADGTFFHTSNNVLLALPKGYDETLGRMAPAEALRYLANGGREDLDLVILDGPDAVEDDAEAVLRRVDDVVLLDVGASPFDSESRSRRFAFALAKVRVIVGFEAASANAPDRVELGEAAEADSLMRRRRRAFRS